MDESAFKLSDSELLGVAIHEAAHLVVRYLLHGNIDIIESVSVSPKSGSIGRNLEYEITKRNELAHAFDYDDDFFEVGGYAYKECCYSLAGVIADKIYENKDDIPFSNSDEDMISLYSFLGICLDSDEIHSLVDRAIPDTEKLVMNNFNLINKVAFAIFSSPEHHLDNRSLSAILVEC